MSSHQTSPYRSIPDFQRWDRAELRPLDVSPVPPRFEFTKSTPIVTAGSCFAQNIAKRLKSLGYNYLVAEPDPSPTGFSAKYGNIYTVAHLRQLIDRAYGRLTPVEQHWEVDGRFFDPYRPSVTPGGFVSSQELLAEQSKHFAAVRSALENCNVFIFTLGLTEGWINKSDRSAYPVCPGAGFGKFDVNKYEFHNYTLEEVMQDLDQVFHDLRQINPQINVLLTVSPIPLAATMESQHVAVSTAYSKSVLRVACETATRKHSFVDYFPSFEIVNWGRSMSSYFTGDLRTVSDAGINHVMRTFFQRYAGHAIDDETSGEKAWCDDDLLLEGSFNTSAARPRARKLTADEEYALEQQHTARNSFAKKFQVTAQRPPHPYVGWKNRPGDQVMFGRTLDANGFYNSRNIADFMGPEHKRICVIGPSIIMDLENDEPDTVCGMLQQELNARGYKHAFVYNCGIQGSNTAMDVSNLLHYVTDFSPDVVVSVSGVNDIRSQNNGDPRPGYPSSFFLWESVLRSFRVEGVPPNVEAYLEDFHYDLDELRAKVGFQSKKWFRAICDAYENYIFRMRALSKGFDFGLLIVDPPTKRSHRFDRAAAIIENSSFSMDQVRRADFFGSQLPALAEKNEFHSHRLGDLVDDLDSESVFTDGIHMRRVGYERLAKHIADDLVTFFPDRIAKP